MCLPAKARFRSLSPGSRKRAGIPQLLATVLVTIALAAPFAASNATGDAVVHAHSEARVPAERFVCGYDPHGSTDELSNHKSNLLALRNRDHEILSRRIHASAPVENAEDIALVQDDGSIVVSPAKFDLKNSSILFTPDDDGYRISTANVNFNKDFGFRLGLEARFPSSCCDSSSRQFRLSSQRPQESMVPESGRFSGRSFCR